MFYLFVTLQISKSVNQFTQHVSRVHEEETPEVIQNELSKYDEWSPNIKISNVHENEKFTCSICFKILGTKATLKQHMYNIHEKKRFGYKKDSERHFEKVHEGIEIDN